jgi:hypothetical protein
MLPTPLSILHFSDTAALSAWKIFTQGPEKCKQMAHHARGYMKKLVCTTLSGGPKHNKCASSYYSSNANARLRVHYVGQCHTCRLLSHFGTFSVGWDTRFICRVSFLSSRATVFSIYYTLSLRLRFPHLLPLSSLASAFHESTP